jgi:DNA polymerase elongation subunit (family B)
MLPDPMKQEYEKTLWPFIQISKKRYVGNLYDSDDIHKFSQKSMGIVLKRCDNAQIVKIVCGGIVNELLNKHDPEGAVRFTTQTLTKLFSDKNPFTIDKFIITKTLREEYKNRNSIAHAVLADRIAEREPGNKPLSNDRIPYVFIIPKHEVKLQGERIETPDYVIQNKLQIDYLYYVTNQIMKPAMQFLELIVPDPKKYFDHFIVNEISKRNGLTYRKPKKSIMSYYDY